MKPAQRPQCGAGLLEIVITLAVIATGLLGLAQWQLRTWQQNRHAYQITLAILLLSDMSERLRANPQLLDIYAGQQNHTHAVSSIAFANSDLAAWQALVSDPLHGLPQGLGSVVWDARQVLIRIEWDDQRPGTQPADPCATTAARPACLEMHGSSW
jgi:type IV pilus assembly protein PilV